MRTPTFFGILRLPVESDLLELMLKPGFGGHSRAKTPQGTHYEEGCFDSVPKRHEVLAFLRTKKGMPERGERRSMSQGGSSARDASVTPSISR